MVTLCLTTVKESASYRNFRFISKKKRDWCTKCSKNTTLENPGFSTNRITQGVSDLFERSPNHVMTSIRL